MAGILKRQILKKLARFTKTLTPDDIDLNLSKGIGVLKNLELDAEYISDITHLPLWLEISSIVCDNIKVEVHITKIQTKPIHIVIDSIDVKISVIDEMKLRQKHEVPPRKQTSGYD
ncbi:UHRF1-binding protein 1-like [Oopsacas minuta]|uniref:UHRF1-binding protein 1-like n=1 Tax=Oopsacas minuta TaxID=111878 RepID=A0AAV7JRH0_9METZ|nr:UHRF1-binding protein 1-like [Oopsacas minuta]